MLKWLTILAVLTVAAVWIHDSGFFSMKLTHKSHHGAADLFMAAIMEQDLAKMQQHTRGSAYNQCSAILSTVQSSPSKMTRYLVDCGGSPGSGTRTSGRAACYGSGGELYMQVAFTIEKFGSEWYVSEAGTDIRNTSGGTSHNR